LIPIAALLFTLTVSLLVTRIAAVALTLTGLSEQVAKFQARSAFTGTGFTTGEAESIAGHPVRRRIISSLMLIGNLGIAAVTASTIVSFMDRDNDTTNLLWRLAFLMIGLVTLWLVSTRQWVDRLIARWTEKALLRWTRLDVCDYVSLLHLQDGYVVSEMVINDGDWIAEKSLTESRVALEGILILGIHRADGQYMGSPNGKTTILGGDTLSLYGRIKRLEELDLRKKGYAGDKAHRVAVQEQMQQANRDESGDNEDVK